MLLQLTFNKAFVLRIKFKSLFKKKKKSKLQKTRDLVNNFHIAEDGKPKDCFSF